MSTGMIHDGMRRKGYVPERAYVMDKAIRFWYRPLAIKTRAAYLEGLDRQTTAADRETVSLGMISRQLIEWDLKYPSDWPEEKLRGEVVPTKDADLLLKGLDPFIQRTIAAVIGGLMASPLDPLDEEAIRQEHAKLQGLSPGDVMKAMAEAEGERVGNSSAEPV